jgi:hypothetical protein
MTGGCGVVNRGNPGSARLPGAAETDKEPRVGLAADTPGNSVDTNPVAAAPAERT